MVLSLFVLVGNPLIVVILMNLLGYRMRTAFMSGLTVAQISEFSLILIALGYSFGHLNQEAVSLVTLVGVITIAGSTYLILHADKIYPWVKPILKLITFRKPRREMSFSETNQPEIIVVGYDRVGYDIVKAVQKIGNRYLVIDFNPKTIARLADNNLPYRYGDAEDVEFLEEIGLSRAKLVISTIPDVKTNLLLVDYYRLRNRDGVILVISDYVNDTLELYKAGASYVVMPHHVGARYVADLVISHQFDQHKFEKEKINHLENLARRESRT